MRWLRRIDDFPIILFKHLALLIGQASLRVVKDQTGPQRCKSRVDMNWIGIAREVYSVNTVIRVVSANPLDTL